MKLFGFLHCDKPRGMTSRDVVNVVQRRIRGVKVGHAGTLDPLADGVLVLGIGPAVRLVPYVQQTPKLYQAAFQLGVSSPSGDTEQPLTEHRDLPVPTLDQLRAAAVQLTGEIEQTPPAYSALWIDGRRAYDRIRNGEDVEMPIRRVRVDTFRITSYDFPELTAEIQCGSGTYIRSLGIDLACLCGTTAVMTSLTRQAVGPFRIEDASSLDSLRNDPLESHISSAIKGVAHLPKLTVDPDAVQKLIYGQFLEFVELEHPTVRDGDVAAAIDQDGNLSAIVRRAEDHWRPYRVFAANRSLSQNT